MKTFNWDEASPGQAKQVEDTRQLEPRTTGHGPFATGDNKLEQYQRNHPAFGPTGDRCNPDQQKK